MTLKGFEDPVTAFDLRAGDAARSQPAPPVTRVIARDHRQPGYQAPTVNVATSLPKRSAGSSVLIVPVVSTGDEDRPGAVVTAAEPFLTAEAVGEIEAGLRALERHGRQRTGHRLVVPSLPVASVLTIGLGKPRSEWPADTIRRAAGVAARSLGGTEAVITTLSELPGEASAPPPSRG